MQPDNAALFARACRLIDNMKPDHTPEENLNRLFRKNIRGDAQLERDRPTLTPENTVVTFESRPKSYWAGLAPDGAARASEGAITVVRYRGQDRLIDGNHRCRYWRDNPDKAKDEHIAYVLEVKEKGRG